LTVTAGRNTLVRQTNLTLQGFRHLIEQIDAQTRLDKIPPVTTKATTTSRKPSRVKKVELGPVESRHEDARTFEGSGYVPDENEDPGENDGNGYYPVIHSNTRRNNRSRLQGPGTDDEDDRRDPQWSDEDWSLNSGASSPSTSTRANHNIWSQSGAAVVTVERLDYFDSRLLED